MIKLIKNEFKKIGIVKIVFVFIIYLLILFVILKIYGSEKLLKVSYNLIPFIGLTSIIIFGGIISSEYTNGSLKYYLSKPIKRWKIYLSKLLTIYIFLFLLISFIIFISLILTISFDIKYIIKYFIYSIPLILIGVQILLLSTIFKSTSIVVGINMFILTFSFMLSQVLLGYNINIIEYTPLPYLDLNVFSDISVINDINNALETNLSIKKGVIIDIIYSILFYLYGNRLFIRKDIRL